MNPYMMYQTPGYGQTPPQKKPVSTGLIIGIVVVVFIVIVFFMIIIASAGGAGGGANIAECQIFYGDPDTENAGLMFDYRDYIPECVLTCDNVIETITKAKGEKNMLVDQYSSMSIVGESMAYAVKSKWRLFRDDTQSVNSSLGCPTVDVGAL